MAVPKKIAKQNQDRLKFVDTKADNLEMNVEDLEEKMFKKLQTMLITQLNLDADGNIKRTGKNLRVVSKFASIRKMILTPEYINQVEIFLNSFDQVAEKTNSYFRNLPENA